MLTNLQSIGVISIDKISILNLLAIFGVYQSSAINFVPGISDIVLNKNVESTRSAINRYTIIAISILGNSILVNAGFFKLTSIKSKLTRLSLVTGQSECCRIYYTNALSTPE